MLEDLKLKELEIIKVDYLEGTMEHGNIAWRVGNQGYITRTDPSVAKFWDEFNKARAWPEKAIWYFSNVPGKGFDSQIAIRVAHQGRLFFNFNILQKPEELNEARWNEIIAGAQLAYKKIMGEKNVTIH